MMDSRHGGPAFPFKLEMQNGDGSVATLYNHGMTLRDYFAAQVLQGMCAGLERGDNPDALPEFAYHMADAMLEARR